MLTPKNKTKLFENIFFRGGHLNGKNFDENFLTEAKSVVNVALGTARGYVEWDSLSDFGYILNKRITMEELRRANGKFDRKKGLDPYNRHPCLMKNFKLLYLSLFLHVLNTCFEVGFRPFKQVSLILVKKTAKTASSPSAYRCIRLALHAGQLLERIMDDRIRSLEILNVEEVHGFRKGRSSMTFSINEYRTWKWKLKQNIHVLLLSLTWRKRLTRLILISSCNAFWRENMKGRKFLLIENSLNTRKVSIRVNDIRGISFNPSIAVPQRGVYHLICSSFFSRACLRNTKHSIGILIIVPASAVPVNQSNALSLPKSFVENEDF